MWSSHSRWSLSFLSYLTFISKSIKLTRLKLPMQLTLLPCGIQVVGKNENLESSKWNWKELSWKILAEVWKFNRSWKEATFDFPTARSSQLSFPTTYILEVLGRNCSISVELGHFQFFPFIFKNSALQYRLYSFLIFAFFEILHR